LDASTILSGYGLAGLVIAALAAATVTLYRQNQKLHEEWRTWLQKSNEELEESNRRYQDTVEKIAQLGERMTNSVRPGRG
jgi:3-hydroxyacyl-CoA dehydrogenase